ncbi:hypothetical protein N5P37_005559 [Trichoderma harzianum]|uniref:BZIP domain-containing protein n=1 Tax=Trichoderma harzianum CBS 226.95 TaxID=983964 RepID=A0A2T4ABL9_TRIHA|nr:hypothetical protein M431DRAFT_494677 [Trichoderma harzianum CBS 226.95]KAK0762741.1 hypothetical protein N5P37_005559 [Trichoderma harzianum]PTB54442.1 hypothetical protein M431DRAFT_494677 [Trichoderma harzianum CBS 226.95]
MRDTWVPFVLGPQDDWSKVTNGEDRKRIQNRLSQRARRAQLKAKRSPPKTSFVRAVDDVTTQSSPDTATSSSSVLSLVGDLNGESLLSSPDGSNTAYPLATITEAGTDEDIPTQSRPTEALVTTSRHSLPYPETPPLNLNQEFLFLTSTNIIAAYIANATLLQISCTTTHPRTFHITTSSAPASLEPTLLQKTIPHPPVIDIIPFPGVRNRLIRSLDVIDLGKLSQDLVDGAFRVWGHAAWDGMGWEVTEAFARRWWFLMDEQLISVTNFWRRQRLENELIMRNDEVSVET